MSLFICWLFAYYSGLIFDNSEHCEFLKSEIVATQAPQAESNTSNPSGSGVRGFGFFILTIGYVFAAWGESPVYSMCLITTRMLLLAIFLLPSFFRWYCHLSWPYHWLGRNWTLLLRQFKKYIFNSMIISIAVSHHDGWKYVRSDGRPLLVGVAAK